MISNQTAISGGTSSIIGTSTGGSVSGNNIVPQIEFYLTYSNDGITASQDLGTVQVVLQRTVENKTMESTTVDVQILTRTTNLSSLNVDLYATQTGSYAGRLYIPAGSSRSLTLTNVVAGEGANLLTAESALSQHGFTVSMQAIRNQGWLPSGLREGLCDLGGFKKENPVQIGTTDSRYEAPIEFTLKNAPGFSPKTEDTVTPTLTDASKDPVQVTLYGNGESCWHIQKN